MKKKEKKKTKELERSVNYNFRRHKIEERRRKWPYGCKRAAKKGTGQDEGWRSGQG